MGDDLAAAQRTQLSELNVRARTYTIQMWTVPLTYLGVTAVLFTGESEKFSLTAKLFMGSVLGVFVMAHLVGVEDGRDRAVKALIDIEKDLGLAEISQNRPYLMWSLSAATAFFVGFMLGVGVSRF